MSRKKSESKEQGGFGKMFVTIVAASVVFSAGLITGQRILHRKALPPMVSLSATGAATATASPTAAKAEEPLATSFSFYEHLTARADAAEVPAAEQKTEGQKKATEAPKADPAKTEPAKAEETPVPTEKAEKVEPPKPAPKAEPKAEPEAEPTGGVGQTVADAAATLQEAVEVIKSPSSDDEALPARYTLQVSSHPSRESAEQEIDRLRRVGVEPNVLSVNVPGKGTLFRVRVGKFHSMDEARHFQASLKEKRGVAGFVTPL